MRKKEEMDTTGNPSVYKKIHHSFVCGCPICPPNRGCNSKRKWKKHVSWKKTRKTQYKVKSVFSE